MILSKTLRMVLLWMAIELIAWIPLDIYFLNYLENQAIQQARQSLVQQIQQLAHFGPAAPLALKTIKIQLPFEFQSLSTRGVVLWDSIDADRHQKVIEQPHFLLNHALKNMTQQDQIEYADQLGAFKRNDDGQLFLGSISKKNILTHKGHWIEQVMLLNLMLICLTGILGIVLLKTKKIALLNPLSEATPSLTDEPSNTTFAGLISLKSDNLQPHLPFPAPLKIKLRSKNARKTVRSYLIIFQPDITKFRPTTKQERNLIRLIFGARSKFQVGLLYTCVKSKV